jgi:hypothetical protein
MQLAQMSSGASCRPLSLFASTRYSSRDLFPGDDAHANKTPQRLIKYVATSGSTHQMIKYRKALRSRVSCNELQYARPFSRESPRQLGSSATDLYGTTVKCQIPVRSRWEMPRSTGKRSPGPRRRSIHSPTFRNITLEEFRYYLWLSWLIPVAAGIEPDLRWIYGSRQKGTGLIPATRFGAPPISRGRPAEMAAMSPDPRDME